MSDDGLIKSVLTNVSGQGLVRVLGFGVGWLAGVGHWHGAGCGRRAVCLHGCGMAWQPASSRCSLSPAFLPCLCSLPLITQAEPHSFKLTPQTSQPQPHTLPPPSLSPSLQLCLPASERGQVQQRRAQHCLPHERGRVPEAVPLQRGTGGELGQAARQPELQRPGAAGEGGGGCSELGWEPGAHMQLCCRASLHGGIRAIQQLGQGSPRSLLALPPPFGPLTCTLYPTSDVPCIPSHLALPPSPPVLACRSTASSLATCSSGCSPLLGMRVTP